MQALRDAALLVFLILVLLSVRVSLPQGSAPAAALTRAAAAETASTFDAGIAAPAPRLASGAPHGVPMLLVLETDRSGGSSGTLERPTTRVKRVRLRG